MPQVYVSSTYEDLINERAAACQAIRRLRHHPISMEDYGASEERPLQKCLRDVRECRGFIGILGWRSGFSPDRSGLSISRLEYEEARRNRIPTLMYLVPDSARSVTYPCDTDSTKIREFREHCRREHNAPFFTSPDDLRFQVSADLNSRLGQARPNRLYLPSLCDRYTLVEQLRQRLARCREADFDSPVVCGLHGDESQSLTLFCDRVKDYYLPQILKSHIPFECRLRWPASSTQTSFLASLHSEMCQSLELDEKSDYSDIEIALRRTRLPVLVTTEVRTDNWQRNGHALLSSFVSFWDHLPRAAREHPLIVLLIVRHRTRVSGIFRRLRHLRLRSRLIADLKIAFNGLAQSDRVELLSELSDLRYHDVFEWARSSVVSCQFPDLHASERLGAIFARVDRLPMQHAIEHLADILDSAYSNNEHTSESQPLYR